VYPGQALAVRPIDVHGVADVHDAGLDLTQLGAVGVLEVECVPEAERLAVDAVDPLAFGVLDPVVVSDGEDLLPHLVPGGGAAAAKYLSFLAAFFPPVSQAHVSVPLRCEARVGRERPSFRSTTQRPAGRARNHHPSRAILSRALWRTGYEARRA
jgi:hypothetical protein